MSLKSVSNLMSFSWKGFFFRDYMDVFACVAIYALYQPHI